MVEIFAGGDFERAAKSLNLTSVMQTYLYTTSDGGYRENYQVWALSDEDFSNLCSIDEKDWCKEWGWWRHSDGANLGVAAVWYTICHERLRAWDGYARIHLCDGCHGAERKICSGSDRDKILCVGNSRNYKDILDYLHNELGASTATNVCACAIELAKQNNMKLSELFKKYLG